MNLTSVVYLPQHNDYIYVGRPTIHGNPFHLGADGTREEVVWKHFLYFHRRIQSDPLFKQEVLKLAGGKLGCYCHEWNGIGDNPLYCHADNIASYLNNLLYIFHINPHSSLHNNL